LSVLQVRKNIQSDHSKAKDQDRPSCGDNNRDDVNIVSGDNDEEDDIDDDVEIHETDEGWRFTFDDKAYSATSNCGS